MFLPPAVIAILATTSSTTEHTAFPSSYCLQYNLVHISVGDLLREQVAQGTPAGVRERVGEGGVQQEGQRERECWRASVVELRPADSHDTEQHTRLSSHWQ